MEIKISEHTFRRLQSHAQPLVDTVEDVIEKLLDQADNSALRATPKPDEEKNEMHVNDLPALSDFRKELWELVILNLPREFSLHDVYKRSDLLVKMRPHVKEMEASIRGAMNNLRRMGYLQSTGRGLYRRATG